MLTTFRLNGFVRITDPKRARRFYEEVLGLNFEYENPYVTVFSRGHTQIIAQRVDEVVPIAATVLGWEVRGIEKVVSALRDRGAVFERYEGMQQDDLGIWKSPAGKVAWFKDPDGNIVSVSEHAAAATGRASRSRRPRTAQRRKPKRLPQRSRPNTRLQPTPRGKILTRRG
jgi:catechol 2,3-dioxygenase-like lactoylglutathione lyase family enzyme